ncbi:MAG: hypothetical protein HY834_12235 [Devosia nanyangense]|uniref:Uncharacterized protein n=1 Tax=Devosia nanyangense TaxID=1228055 RepID=A0A933L546_9HYPH|nr:hypothetical protein [Devosia nanyangense]
MKRLIVSAAFAALAAPAMAGGGFMCSGEGVEAMFPLGGGAGFSLLEAEIRAKGKIWSTVARPDVIEIAVSQAFSGNHRIAFDLTDPNMQQVVAEIRLFWTEEESDPVFGGTLKMPGEGAWAIACDAG